MYRRIILNRLNNCTSLLKPIDQNMIEKNYSFIRNGINV